MLLFGARWKTTAVSSSSRRSAAIACDGAFRAEAKQACLLGRAPVLLPGLIHLVAVRRLADGAHIRVFLSGLAKVQAEIPEDCAASIFAMAATAQGIGSEYQQHALATYPRSTSARGSA